MAETRLTYPVIYILHYHLLTGGVTSIIKSQVRSLVTDGMSDIHVICGECPDPQPFEELGAKVLEHKNLNYLPEDAPSDDIAAIYQGIKDFMWGIIGLPGIIHVHNLNLGKNPILTYVIYEIARAGNPVVNHVHDFAEDRPDRMKFLKKVLEGEFKANIDTVMYPNLENYSYITLNSHDRNRVIQKGIDPDRVTVIPNPVDIDSRNHHALKKDFSPMIRKKLGLDKQKKIIIYPVRVIRRKNIGEFILLSCLFPDEAEWLVTQPPKNPVEIRPYRKWKAFCKKERLPVIFEAGNKVDFNKLMYAADLCLTTSVSEGFGMVFIEPWLYGTAVRGRKIPEVIDDLKAEGVHIPGLYKRFRVKWKGRVKDFPELDMEEQMKFIRQVKNDAGLRKDILKRNPFLNKLLDQPNRKLIGKNISTIVKTFSLTKNKERLHEVYQKLP